MYTYAKTLLTVLMAFLLSIFACTGPRGTIKNQPTHKTIRKVLVEDGKIITRKCDEDGRCEEAVRGFVYDVKFKPSGNRANDLLQLALILEQRVAVENKLNRLAREQQVVEAYQEVSPFSRSLEAVQSILEKEKPPINLDAHNRKLTSLDKRVGKLTSSVKGMVRDALEHAMETDHSKYTDLLSESLKESRRDYKMFRKAVFSILEIIVKKDPIHVGEQPASTVILPADWSYPAPPKVIN